MQKGYIDTVHTDTRGMGGGGRWMECVHNDGMGVWREWMYDVRNVRPTEKRAINDNQCKKTQLFRPRRRKHVKTKSVKNRLSTNSGV